MLPFPTATEAAEQARSKYLVAQIEEVKEAVKKAIAKGLYQTWTQVTTPPHYSAEEDAHRSAAFALAFPAYKLTFGTGGPGKWGLTIAWIPNAPLPLVPTAAEKQTASAPLVSPLAALIVAVIERECNATVPEGGTMSMSNTLPLPFEFPLDKASSDVLLKEIRTRLEGMNKYTSIALGIESYPKFKRDEIAYKVSW
jgi:hypothetical protein